MTSLLKLALLAALLATGVRVIWIVWPSAEPVSVISAEPAPRSIPPPLSGHSGPKYVRSETPLVETPEPPIAVLVGIGLVGLGLLARKSSWWSRLR